MSFEKEATLQKILHGNKAGKLKLPPLPTNPPLGCEAGVTIQVATPPHTEPATIANSAVEAIASFIRKSKWLLPTDDRQGSAWIELFFAYRASGGKLLTQE